MMHPELKVNFEALTKDAKIWDDMGDKLAQASTGIAGIDVYHEAFSFAGQDIAARYAQVHATVVQLLAAGAQKAHAGADVLIAVRDDFDHTEDIHESTYYAMWQPVA